MSRTKKTFQIDVKKITENLIECNMYTEHRCAKIYMSPFDYKELVRTGFFIRDGKETDSANVWNTTDVYQEIEDAF